jgi:hypothetical protein
MTKRLLLALTTAGLLATGIVAAPAANAAPTQFKNCASMHKVYKHGVAKDKKSQQRAVKNGAYKPVVKKVVYDNSYKSLDRDKDGVMCEVPR